MLSFKRFLEEQNVQEANLGTHPDNYPAGSIVSLNRGKVIGPYKEKDIFTVNSISSTPNKRKLPVYNVTTGSSKNIIYVTLTDIHNKQFVVQISKSAADSYFLKGSRSRAGANTNVIFTNKELAPTALGLGDKKLNKKQIISALQSNLKYDKETNNFLLGLAQTVNAKGSNFEVNIPEKFVSELNVVSKDYGELLSAIWVLNNVPGISSIVFPKSSNAALVDFYANEGTTPHPYSIKSEGGSKVTIGNILNGIKDMFDDPEAGKLVKNSFNKQELKYIDMLNTIIDLPMRSGMIEGHKLLNTDGINALAQAMNMSTQDVTNETINEWLKTKTGKQIKQKLEKFYAAVGSRPLDKMFESERDKNRLVIGPLGESLKRILNKNEAAVNTLIKMANLLKTTQVNISISPKKISFSIAKFSESKFKFDWAGYSGGNKLGFIKV
jgi:hypothetical protein